MPSQVDAKNTNCQVLVLERTYLSSCCTRTLNSQVLSLYRTHLPSCYTVGAIYSYLYLVLHAYVQRFDGIFL